MVVAWFEAVARHLHWGTEENHGNLDQDNRCLGRDWNPAPHRYKSEALPLEHSCLVKIIMSTTSLRAENAWILTFTFPWRLCRMVLMHKRIVSTMFVCATVDGARVVCVRAPTASCTVHFVDHLLICPQHHMPTVTTYGTQSTGPKQAVVTNTKRILIINRSGSWQFFAINRLLLMFRRYGMSASCLKHVQPNMPFYVDLKPGVSNARMYFGEVWKLVLWK